MSRSSSARKPAPRQSSQGSTLIGVFVGLVVGVLIAAVLAWYFSRDYPFQNPQQNALPHIGQSNPAEAPRALPGKPGDKPAAPEKGEDKDFDFYKILPQGGDAALPPAQQSAPAAVASEKLYLQLGAFSDPSEADNLKARLALLGVEASVQRLDTPDKGTLHRVRAGPYASPEEMGTVRAQLAQLGIESSVVKVKSGQPAQ